MSQNCREVHLSVSRETPVERIRDILSAIEWSWLPLNGAQTEIQLSEGTEHLNGRCVLVGEKY
jgi:hypothetical protein